MAAFAVSSGFEPEACADKPFRLGLMGGTFDPLHEGHIACAQVAVQACELDGVLFIPAANPSFKQGRELAPAAQRLAWCEAALQDFPAFGTCDIELRREGVTYTVDTLRELHEAYPNQVEFFFIMGADSAASLPRWHKADELAGLTRFVAVSRPGQQLDESLRVSLAEAGFKVDYVDSLNCDVSSSDIRARLAAGRSVVGLVPEVILPSVECCSIYRR